MALLIALLAVALIVAATLLTGRRRFAATRLLSGVLLGLALAQFLSTVGMVR
ncbi:hypothetical protein MKK70_04915 [Methylobacterium sp. E-041]|uniref:hypothetical protein n=1 Tax=Methylobacterium sp. E-041 TaxID=2836573 RepID=UPI001FB913CE|nr:hypothetical protein [Methylobacterium sp. E-041]MCJ2104728.1 hypothetical protein [Methylobacterium sp. E-041]